MNRLRERLLTNLTKGDGERNVLICDVVSGASDVSILTIGDGILEVKVFNMDMSPSSSCPQIDPVSTVVHH